MIQVAKKIYDYCELMTTLMRIAVQNAGKPTSLPTSTINLRVQAGMAQV